MPTRRTARTLQPKLDRILAECIGNIRSLGYSPVGTIEPHVRITSNKRGLGLCKETTGAYYHRRGDKPGTRRLRSGAHPNFQISCSVNAGSSDAEFYDVLYHEVIHTLPGCFSHGREFKEAASAVNAAFGANVQTTKRDGEGADGAMPIEEAKAKVAALVGCEFETRGKAYRLVAMNSRPKRCCDIVETKTGRPYIAEPGFVLSGTITKQPGDAVPAGPAPVAAGGQPARDQVASLVGSTFRIGKRLMRLKGLNSRPKNCCDLVEVFSGREFVAPAESVLAAIRAR